MRDSERIIGELAEFKRATLEELRDIKKDLRGLQRFKWRVAGGAATLSMLLTAIAEFLHISLGK